MPHIYEVRWARVAEQDLEAIVEYIARDGVNPALEVLTRLREAVSSLSSMLQRGRVVPELQAHGIQDYHEVVVSPWRVIYRIDKQLVYVLALFDSRRNFEDILLERVTR